MLSSTEDSRFYYSDDGDDAKKQIVENKTKKEGNLTELFDTFSRYLNHL